MAVVQIHRPAPPAPRGKRQRRAAVERSLRSETVSMARVAAMRRLLAVGLLAVLLVGCTGDDSPTVGPASTSPETTTTLAPGTVPTTATTAPAGGATVPLTPAAVVGGGDQDATGTAATRLVPE